MDHLSQYIKEAMSFTRKIELEFTISKSFHATERQSRHGNDEKAFISDDEILEEVRKASEAIIEDIIQDHIDMGDRFVVRDANTDLNIVCQIHPGSKGKDSVRVDIVTVIRAEKFWNTKNNWVVMIR